MAHFPLSCPTCCNASGSCKDVLHLLHLLVGLVDVINNLVHLQDPAWAKGVGKCESSGSLYVKFRIAKIFCLDSSR